MNRTIIPAVLWLGGMLISMACPVAAESIHRAIAEDDLPLVESLLSKNAELLNARDDSGRTPLNLAAELGRGEILRTLVDRGANVDWPDHQNRSPLHSAAAAGDTGMVGLLLRKGATTINDTSCIQHGGMTGGWTPLHFACLNGHPEVVRILLDQGANIEARDGAQRTPLILAAEGKSLQVAKLLLERGADINAEAIRGYTALLNGIRTGFTEYVDLLIAHGAGISSAAMPRVLGMAVNAGMVNLYNYVLASGCNLDEVRERDPGLVFPAAAGGSVAIVKSLVERGFSPVQTDANGLSPIHAAAMGGRTGVIEYLAGLGVDLNARNKKGESAFNLATMRNFTETSEYLRRAGADTSGPQFPILSGPYMGQPPPGDTPQLFLPGIVSASDRAHSSITFSPDGLEAYWTEMIPPDGRVACMQVRDGQWTAPVAASVDRDPTFSQDGGRLYFIKTRPFQEGETPGGDPDVKEEYWYMERTDTGWSEPISVGQKVNALPIHWPCSVDDQGDLYFSEFADRMYCARLIDGAYDTPVRLTESLGNATLVGASPCMARDGSFLIFCAHDSLHVSFKRKDGSWTDRINLGGVINGSHVNGSPRITADGRHMFFVSAGQGRPWGIYWVSAGFLERLRPKD